ncbi:B3 domain-containing protein Os03g0212300-like [Solanum lycopersicum]|uniref:B3 domain-containing protein Os03g0212300-like n=1 Tax=Solanum lycopersicum TaxID=4081 RepID=UPI003749AAC0
MANEFHGSSLRSSSPNNPKFIQIITSLDELSRLRIPVVFAKRYCEKMLNPVFLEAPHGKVWEVEVENSQGQIWLAKGWSDFCDYYSIIVKSILIFTYNPRCHFAVAIYDQSKTEIEYPIDQDIESDEQEEDILVAQANANVIQKHKEVGQAHSISEKVGPNNYSSRYSLVDLTGDNPFFEMVIKKSHATCMAIPLRFAQQTDILNMKNMRLVNEEGVEWKVEIEYTRSMVIIKEGWSAFRKDNKIAYGETCRFKLIRGPIANVLQKKKTNSSQTNAGTISAATTTVAHNLSNAAFVLAEKPAKIYGVDFKKWQQKMFFYLTTLSLQKFINENVLVMANECRGPKKEKKKKDQANLAKEKWTISV